MRFEQAFFTREDEGLDTYAFSRPSPEFKNNCTKVGSRFEIEPEQDTAEFVYYSNEFGRYVGVGVSPSSYEFHSGKNRLVHIWIPEECTDDPSQIYLKYEFDRKYDRERKYEDQEFFPVIERTDYRKIIQKYGLTEKKLAELLEKTMPLAFGEKNFLAMILREEHYERKEFPEIARELTWLISTLLPVPKEDRKDYYQHFSYSVQSVNNISVVNLAYVTGKQEGNEYFDLSEEAEKENRDSYRMLAKKALESLEGYEEFLKELYQFRLEPDMNSENFEIMFFYWKQQKETTVIRPEDLPMPWTEIINRAKRNLQYRKLFYALAGRLENLTVNDLIEMHGYIFEEDLKKFKEPICQEFWNAYTSVLLKVFATGRRQLYRQYMENNEKETRRCIFIRLWSEESIHHCMAEDMEQNSNEKEFLETLRYYEPFWEEAEFIARMRSQALEQGYYFQLDLQERKEVSQILGRTASGKESWKCAMEGKIRQFFHMDSDYITFMENEMDRIEEEFVPTYFSCYLHNCRLETEESSKLQLQRSGRSYLKMYKDLINEKDLEEFQSLDRGWSVERLDICIRGLSLEKLAEFQFGGFEKDLQLYKKEFRTLWYQMIMSRMQENKTGQRTPEEITGEQSKEQDRILTVLVRGASGKNFLNEETQKTYMDAVWEFCGDSLVKRVYCSVRLGVKEYSIWNWMGLCETTCYEAFFEYSKPAEGQYNLERRKEADLIEKTTVGKIPEGEFNRRCYLLWKKIHTFQIYRLQGDLTEDFTGTDRNLFIHFLEYLQMEIVEYIERYAEPDTGSNGKLRNREFSDICLRCGINYINLWRRQEIVSGEADGGMKVYRCERYKVLKETHEVFYGELLQIAENDVLAQHMEEEKQWLNELKVYEALDTREHMTEENMEETGVLLGLAEYTFGEELWLVKVLGEEFETFMAKGKEKLDKFFNQIQGEKIRSQSLQKEIEEIDRQMELLKLKKQEKETEKSSVDRQIQRDKSKYEEQEKKYQRSWGSRREIKKNGFKKWENPGESEERKAQEKREESENLKRAEELKKTEEPEKQEKFEESTSTENVKSAENVKSIENVKSTENVKSAENIKNSENPENQRESGFTDLTANARDYIW